MHTIFTIGYSRYNVPFFFIVRNRNHYFLCLFAVQVGIFSATMPKPVLDLARKMIKAPVQMLVPDKYTLDGVRQYYVAVEEDDYRLLTLYHLFDYYTISQAII